MGRGAGKSLVKQTTTSMTKKVPQALQPAKVALFRQGNKAREIVPENLDDFTDKLVSPAGGSNPGGAYLGKDGKKRYIKRYTYPPRAYMEFVANNIYRAAGVPAPNSHIVKAKDGNLAIANDWIETPGRLLSSLKEKDKYPKEVAEEVAKNFLMDFFLINYDAMGLVGDNAMFDENKTIHRIDNGGALLFRARGQQKPDVHLIEPDYMIEDINKYIRGGDGGRKGYKPVFAALGIHDAHDPKFKEIIAPQIEQLRKLRDESNNFEDLVPRVQGVPDDIRNKLLEVLQTRAKMIIGEGDPANSPSFNDFNAISDDLKKFYQKHDITPSKMTWVNQGEFGTAYSLGDGKLLKDTMSESEFNFAKQLSGQQFDHIAQIYDAAKVGNFEYRILQEELNTGGDLQDLFEATTALLKTQNISSMDAIGNFDAAEYIKHNGPIPEKLKEFMTELGGVVADFQKAGILGKAGIRPENLGRDKKTDTLKAFDIDVMNPKIQTEIYKEPIPEQPK